MKEGLDTYKVGQWIVMGKNTFKPPFKISDALINEARIVHVIEGRSKLYSANHLFKLAPGSTLIMKADNFVNDWAENPDSPFNQVIVFQLTADFLKYLYGDQVPSWFQSQPEEVLLSVELAARSPVLDGFFKQLEMLLQQPKFLSEEVLQLKIKELISLLVMNDHTGKIRNLFGALFEAREYDFQEVIQNHLYEDLNLEDLAFLTGLSLSSFKRKFNSIYGTSPNKYISSKRLEKAQTLLRTTDQRISEIAYDCGFSDVGYFSKIFRNYYNISPSDFRKSQLD